MTSSVDDAKEVLRTLAFKEVEVQTKDDLWYQLRILPYRTHSNLIDGIVITFTDIYKFKNCLRRDYQVEPGDPDCT